MICRIIERILKMMWYVDVDVTKESDIVIEEDWQLEEALNGRR